MYVQEVVSIVIQRFDIYKRTRLLGYTVDYLEPDFLTRLGARQNNEELQCVHYVLTMPAFAVRTSPPRRLLSPVKVV